MNKLSVDGNVALLRDSTQKRHIGTVTNSTGCQQTGRNVCKAAFLVLCVLALSLAMVEYHGIRGAVGSSDIASSGRLGSKAK